MIILTVYFALVASSSPSLSQLIIGLGFPWAEQLSRVLPPSLASTYCGGVAVNEGGAVEGARVGVIYVEVNTSTAMFKRCTDQGRNPQLCCSRVYTIKKNPPPLIHLLLQTDKLRFPQLHSAPLHNILVINRGPCTLSALLPAWHKSNARLADLDSCLSIPPFWFLMPVT